ncbi:hypothetical protein [Siphonobacter sp. SORGH_AS_0500]|nr:hypothetical protein [Siphonobacter sp. SORGH_AS_0500]
MYTNQPLRKGLYAILAGLLTLPISCNREQNDTPTPAISKPSGARFSQGGQCTSLTFGKDLGIWSVVPNSRFQVIVAGDGDRQFVGQILPEPEFGSRFLIRGGQFIARGDFSPTSVAQGASGCFEPGPDGNGWFVPGFSVNDLGSSFEQVSANDGSPAYRVKDRFQGVTDVFSTKAYLGVWTVNNTPLEARRIPGIGLVVAQNVTNADSRSQGRDMFMIRGRNILQRGDVNVSNALDRGRTEAFAGAQTGLSGLLPPFSNLTITGYERLPAANGADEAYRRLP